MVEVEGGTFRMGATDQEINSGDAGYDEQPAHDVTLSTYAIGQTEVTFELWDAVMGTNYSSGDNKPAYYITMPQIEEFIKKLNEATGKHFRLPTEAEWEFAARGGNLSKGYLFAGSDNVDEVAWYSGNSSSTVHPVAQKKANELGLYDMCGNVNEWTSEHSYEYTTDAEVNPVHSSTSSLTICRGGSYRSTRRNCRIHTRNSQYAMTPTDYYGFRLVLGGAPTTTYTAGSVTFKMVDVAGGTFQMGYDGTGANSNEKPVHQVTVFDFAIGQTEVTQGLWHAVMGTNPSEFSGDDRLPVESVNWDECQEFITKLNEMVECPNGYEFRLPTEAEWEFAARGGNSSKGYIYAGDDNVASVAWHSGNSASTPHPVGLLKPNELGLYDMSGNVDEWCSDWFTNYTSEALVDPAGPASGTRRVHRGGSWKYSNAACRVSMRNSGTPITSMNNVGLRLVLAPKNTLTFNVNGVEFTMILVRGSSFMMGPTADYEDYNNCPQHKVTLSSYYIAQTELTEGLYNAVMENGGSTTSTFAKESMSWDNCQQFITKLNQLTGKNFSLPTEAEWEFAARGGVRSRGYLFSGSNNGDQVAWNYSNIYDPENYLYLEGAHKVALKAPNELGIYDMSGNVREWVNDYYAEDYYSVSPEFNPTGPTTGTERVLRGGATSDENYYKLTVYAREHQVPTWAGDNVSLAGLTGMRLALPADF